jgi:hypothetical protein
MNPLFPPASPFAAIAAAVAFAAIASGVAGCAGPRAVLHSPEATPKGQWRVGGTLDVSLPTQTSRSMFGGLREGIELLHDQAAESDSAAITADSLNDLAEALVAYSLDPIGAQAGLHVRYGLLPRVDAGYRYAGGVHVFDARVQFLGPVSGAAAADGGGASPGWRGSVAVQYSGQEYTLPAPLDKLQSLLRYEFKRKDILVPLILGRPFGPRGALGEFGLGAAYNLSLIEYDSEILKLVEKLDDGLTRPFAKLRGERAIHAFGGFANARLGFRFVHLLASLAVYRQDYGTYELFGGRRTTLRGWTVQPSGGLEFRF